MKSLLLAGATLAAVACASEPSAVVVRRHAVESDPSPLHALGATDEALATSTTATVPTTTTTEPEPEPVTTTVPVYVAPVTTRRAPATTVYEPPAPQGRTTGRGSEPAGGDVPPDYIKQCESGGDYRAVNPSSGAGGAWQFLPSTWRSVGGTGLPQNATPAEQDYRASILWDNGRGASHWVCA